MQRKRHRESFARWRRRLRCCGEFSLRVVVVAELYDHRRHYCPAEWYPLSSSRRKNLYLALVDVVLGIVLVVVCAVVQHTDLTKRKYTLRQNLHPHFFVAVVAVEY